MADDARAQLAKIRDFPDLLRYLRDEMGWPIETDRFDASAFDDLTFDYTAEELGIDSSTAAKIQEIKRLRPLVAHQPWGIFFIGFEPKRLPVGVLRRILSRFVQRKRASANSAERAAWAVDDLLFVSNYGEGDQRQITFAHFSQEAGSGLPSLRVLGWDNLDTPLHLDRVAELLTEKLAWPHDENDLAGWREMWSSAFTLRHREVVTTSKVLAVRLAALARVIRDRIKTVLAIESENGPVTKLMTAFREALVHDLRSDDFADMYAQTGAYGLLSARVANPHVKSTDGILGQLPITSPFLKELMETFLHVGGPPSGEVGLSDLDFDELGVREVVELLDDANMEAVVRDFGDRSPQEDPVIHFYELFLKEYDAKKRMQRGVFYTPRPVVSYIVHSVDDLLRSELGLEDGLADTTPWGEMAKRHKGLDVPEGVSPNQAFVQILDPATGTGTFLVEVIDVIHRTLVARWRAEGNDDKGIAALWNEYVPQYLLPRLHGYELLMAPYAIAHLKIGLKLHETGYRFTSGQRSRVYLTNALEPSHDSAGRFEFAVPALAHEARAVNEIKRNQRFTVVIGNPPYSDASQNLGPQFASLIEPFRFYQGERIRERGAMRFEHVINNDYVKFWGLGLRLLSEVRFGTVCLITSNTYMGGKSFRGLRDSMWLSCQRIRITDLHGEGWSGELAREGTKDENVFEIQTGVAVCLLMKLPGSKEAVVEYGELIGAYDLKAARLLTHPSPVTFLPVPEDSRSYHSFIPTRGTRHPEYWDFPQLDSLFNLSVDGVKTSRDGLVIANTREECIDKIVSFGRSNEAKSEVESRLCFECNRLDLDEARRHIAGTFDDAKIHKFAYRPYDIRFIYYDEQLILSHRMNTMPRILHTGAEAIVCASRLSAKGFDHAIATRSLCSNKYSSHDINSRMFLVTYGDSGLLGDQLVGGVKPEYLAAAGVPTNLSDIERAKAFGSYILAILNAPSYRDRYLEDIQQDFPRVPLPANAALLEQLGAVGALMADAHCLALTVPHDRFVFRGRIGEPCAAPKLRGDSLWIGESSFIEGVCSELWVLRLAGYQVCSSWFTAGGRSGLARKSSRLSKDLVDGFRQVLFCAEETARLRSMADTIIEQYGGWPGAFQGSAGS
jgi:hypothetical protein